MSEKHHPFWIMLAICVVLTLGVVTILGVPADLWTTAWLGLPFSLCLPLLKLKSRLLYLLPLLPFSFVIAHSESDSLMDVRGGRHGIQFLPHHLRFGGRGVNTVLVADHLGHVPALWKHRTILTMPGSTWRDGNDRLHSRSLLFRDDLSAHLDLLPDFEARKHVLHCITDPDNKVKFHQEMLLLCLKEMGYPPGHDCQSWWKQHQALFTPEHDAKKAAILAGGWTYRIRKNHPDGFGDFSELARSVEYDGGFQLVEEIIQLRSRKNPPDFIVFSNWLWGQPVLPPLGHDQVAWWPKVKPKAG